MPFDLQRARQDTPGCEHVLHFNNAGASLMPRPVLEATIAHLQLEAQIGGYEAAERAHEAIEHVYDAAAALIGCSRDEIAIIENATRAKYLRGPRGTGFLYVRNRILERLEAPMLDLHAAEWVAKDRYEIRPDARRFENWETNYAGKIGLGAALDYALQWGVDTTWRRIKTLAYKLRTQLSPLPGVIVRDRGVTQCGIVTFSVEDKSPDEIVSALSKHNINVSVTTRSSTLLDMDARGLESLVRASVHYYNTDQEVEQ